MAIKAIIFDLDDTLYPEIQFVKSGFNAVANHIATITDRDFIYIYKLIISEFNINEQNVFDRLIKRLKVQNFIKTSELVDIYRNHDPYLNLFDDSLEVLEFLIKHNYKIGIITDGFLTAQRNKIRSLGLEKIMDLIIYTDELGKEYWKPEKKAFEIAINTFLCKPKEAIYIGDNAYKDFIAPNKLGMLSVQIRRQHGLYKNRIFVLPEGKPQYVINDLKQIYKLLS